MTGIDATQTEALVERIFRATIGTLELYSIHLGWRLGLYRALVEGPATVGQLAERAGIDRRYAQEWLEQQAVAGIVQVDDGDAPADARRYALPTGHADVLVDPESGAHVVPFAPMVVGIAGALPDVVEAYRTGHGVPYARYGRDFRDGQGAINRPGFVHEMGSWLGAIPRVHDRLAVAPPAHVADVGCGQGYSTVAIARAYPEARVAGFDLDEASAADARKYVAEAGVADRVTVEVRDAASLAEAGPFDLVCVFEALHDMARPVEALTSLREALGDGGAVLVVDERVAESFTAPGDEVERMMYGWSVTHCLPASREEAPSAALGTALRPRRVQELAADAGFARLDEMEIDNDFFRFYLLTP